MTATILQSELSSLIQDSKKKNLDVRNAAEKSLSDLKTISVTSEAQLAGDLFRRPHFVDPFILACQSRNAKLASGAVVCLQRLAASKALPRERLQDVVNAFQEVTSYGLEVQLKILQTLPSLLQIYASDVQGNLLAAILGVCGDLQDNKAAVVSSTATATFQQLITTVYEKVTQEDANPESKTVESLGIGDASIEMRAAGYDAYRIFKDLCAFASGAQLEFIRIRSVSHTFVMELIDGILHNSEEVFNRHPEQVETCRVYLMPAIFKILSTKQNFALSMRALRILSILLTRHMGQMLVESETAFSLLIRGLDLSNGPSWRRVLIVELLQKVSSDARVLRQVFSVFDQQEGRNKVVGNMMAAFVRIASEKPMLIGIGYESTVPSRRGGNEDNDEGVASLETAGVTGLISATASADSNVTGISMEWSTVKTSYLDQLDKVDVSEPPSTYIYGLILNSVAAFSEGLAKYIMPLTVQSRNQAQHQQQRSDLNDEDEMDDGTEGAEPGRSDSVAATRSTSGKYSMLINPLKLTRHPHFEEVRTCAAMIDECWPAFLATCSTFLNAALDADFYRTIVRAFQKLTQVAGVLELITPRDAMLTTLAKAAVPAGSLAFPTPTVSSKIQSRAVSIAEVPPDAASELSSETEQRSALETPRRSIEQDRPSISTRNLLCLRALINLGIALGGTLNPDSWFTVLETLQHAERVIEISNRVLAQQSTKDANDATNSLVSRTSLGSEISAVQTASRRMFESTAHYSDKSLSNLLLALVRFSGTPKLETTRDSSALSPIPNTPTTPQSKGRMHQYSRSFSTSYAKSGPEPDELQFFLAHISDIARLNLTRLISAPPDQSGWRLIFLSLFHVVRVSDIPSSIRLQAAALMNRVVVECMNALGEDNGSENSQVQLRCLDVFRTQYEMLYQDSPPKAEHSTLDVEIHARILDAMHSVLEACNKISHNGWEIIFRLVCSPYNSEPQAWEVHDIPNLNHDMVKVRSSRLVQPSFNCLQLIGSDFVATLSISDLATFIDALWVFARQDDNLNIALTSTNFFWNIALYLEARIGENQLSWKETKVDEVSVLRDISECNEEYGLNILWILLIIRLLRMTGDNRDDVRDSSLRIAVRVLDLFGQNLSAPLWIAILELMLQAMSKHLQQTTSEAEPSWEKSLIMMTEATIDLLARHSEIITTAATFPQLSQHIFETFNALLSLESLPVASVVYTGTSNFLTVLESCKDLRNQSTSAALALWQARHPADFTTTTASVSLADSNPVHRAETNNQEALTRHAEVFLKLHELFPEQTIRMVNTHAALESMRKTIFECTHPQYTFDVSKPSSEQETILAMLPILYEKMSTQQDDFVRFLLGFVRAALIEVKLVLEIEQARLPKSKVQQRPSFVAFSGKCIDILESVLSTSKAGDSSVVDALHTLSDTIKSKYTSTPQGSKPVLWRNATTKAINVIEFLMPATAEATSAASSWDLRPFLAAVVNVATSIVGPGGLQTLPTQPDNAHILADEAFDMESFSMLHKIIKPNMAIWHGMSQKFREICRNYTILLLQTSFICGPFYGDLPPDLLNSPLKNFSHIRPGTVCSPIFPTRLKVPYLTLDTLFDLAAQPNSAVTQNDSLANAAAPYLLLRCAWALKTFIADQPLRSLSPLPKLLRLDLHAIITKCLQTNTLDHAFDKESLLNGTNSNDTASLGAGGKRHLRLLYPLVLKFLAVWRRVPRLRGGGDWMEEKEAKWIEKGLEEWLSIIGSDWELAD